MTETAPPGAWNVPVSGTQSRPTVLPFFVLGRNNLNPKVTVDGAGLTIKVVQTTRVPFEGIQGAEVSAGLRSTYVTLTAGSWQYLIHFRDEAALVEFLGRLAGAGVRLGPRAQGKLAG